MNEKKSCHRPDVSKKFLGSICNYPRPRGHLQLKVKLEEVKNSNMAKTWEASNALELKVVEKRPERRAMAGLVEDNPNPGPHLKPSKEINQAKKREEEVVSEAQDVPEPPILLPAEVYLEEQDQEQDVPDTLQDVSNLKEQDVP